MAKARYRLDEAGDFIIEDYNRAKAFSSFFPGIAGLRGIPLWAFYVNRGQCVCSFGVKNKDGAILDFLPANQAYNLTSIKGFRTFINIEKGARRTFYEPFRKGARGASSKMRISPFGLEIEETDYSSTLNIKVAYTTVPNEPFAALARKVSITNLSGAKVKLEVLDGLADIVPFGATEWHRKHMSRTIEAWIRVLNTEKGAPFYQLKIDPQDRPELCNIEGGNFYTACMRGGRGTKTLKAVSDPEMIFGADGDISYPGRFAEDRPFNAGLRQHKSGRTPSAFSYAAFTLGGGCSAEIVSLIGAAKGVKEVNRIALKLKKETRYFERKMSENEDIINRIKNRIFTKSSSREFDFYAGQTFLDNALRGGLPVALGARRGGTPAFYAYGRKHGDLERDYNSFSLEPSYYSQGNGAYRDINQNRRNDAFFSPEVNDENIRLFINAIQPDGFNPHLIEGVRFRVKDKKALEAVMRKYIKKSALRKKAGPFLRRAFTPGALAAFIEDERIVSSGKSAALLEDILAIALKEERVRPGEGYWVDHWAYNIDLMESYMACYPERIKRLLLEKRRFSFYDTYLRVNPRSEKYVYYKGKIRQYGAVAEDKEKRALIEARGGEPYKVRTDFGAGAVYRTSLLAKLICLVVNKTASLDPFGVGIEMEAGKPGWCDSLNGLPGIFGSSVCETLELKRMILFITSSLARLGMSDDASIELPEEMTSFLTGVERLIRRWILSKSDRRDFDYWEASSALKERYRKKVWPGFSGAERSVSVKELKRILSGFLIKTEEGLKKGFDRRQGAHISYYINEVKRFDFIYEGGKKRLNQEGLPLVRALSFGRRPMPLFLEAPVHAMRLMDRKEAAFLYKAVRASGMFDKKLKMYKLNAPLKNEPLEIGRSAIFTPGWLENESVWLHMEYKYLLELLKAGLYKEFFGDLKRCLVAFQEPGRYGRSILENSSFITSSAYPDRDMHGRGFVARLTGTTTEFITMWLIMCLGRNPFGTDDKGALYFKPDPAIPGEFFTKDKSSSFFYFTAGPGKRVRFSEGIFAFCVFGKTLAVYHNPKRRDTFGKGAVRPGRIILSRCGKKALRFSGGSVPSPYAEKLRDGFYDRIDIALI